MKLKENTYVDITAAAKLVTINGIPTGFKRFVVNNICGIIYSIVAYENDTIYYKDVSDCGIFNMDNATCFKTINVDSSIENRSARALIKPVALVEMTGNETELIFDMSEIAELNASSIISITTMDGGTKMKSSKKPSKKSSELCKRISEISNIEMVDYNGFIYGMNEHINISACYVSKDIKLSITKGRVKSWNLFESIDDMSAYIEASLTV